MNEAKKIEDLTVSTTELSTVLGLSLRRVQQLIQDGIIPKESKGKFPLCRAVMAYIATVNAKTPSEAVAKVEMDRKTAEARLKAAKARRAEIETKELEGQMHRAEDVRAITEDMVFTIRSALLTLPARVALEVAHTDNPAECQTIIRKEVLEILKELARHEYNPEKYAERVRDRNRMEDPEVQEDEYC